MMIVFIARGEYKHFKNQTIMKKLIFTMVLSLIGNLIMAQTADRIKYVTQGPDGLIAMTIYDNANENNMKLESANEFYRYEILDPITSEAIISSKNKGKKCNLDKSKIGAGTYNLRLYTLNFIITSKLTIKATNKILSTFPSTVENVASSDL